MSRTALTAKTKIIVATLAVLGLGAGAAGLAYNPEPSKPVANSNSQQVETVQEAPTTNLAYQGEEGQNALELLKKKAKVETENSSYGEFVKSINGNDGGGSKYWTFYVNGVMSNVGAGSYTTKASDSIEWKLE